MGDAVTQLPTLVDATRRFRRCVATNAARKGELLEETLHPRHILTLVRVDLGVSSLKVSLRQYRRRSVTWARDVNGIQIIFVDESIKVNVSEALAGVRTPVTQQPRFQMLQPEWLSEKGV